ncbi:MAG: DNA repair protein RadA, partial [Bacteroidales bacterium]|nr:DNA repair protein RadA [Bacteroidales bacterium]
MPKDKIMYVCDNCGQESTKWIGKCPSCGQWNTFKEFRVKASNAAATPSSRSYSADRNSTASRPIPLADINAAEEPRMDLHDEELNRVLGGGLVPGSLVLLGGEPGIGKSTLVLQTILRLTDKRVLYVSGEESARQLKLRADRLSRDTSSPTPNAASTPNANAPSPPKTTLAPPAVVPSPSGEEPPPASPDAPH